MSAHLVLVRTAETVKMGLICTHVRVVVAGWERTATFRLRYARIPTSSRITFAVFECTGALIRRLIRAVGTGQCDDPISSRTVAHCVSVSGKCTGYDDRSAECLACLDGCSGRAGKPGVNNWCWYYNTNFPAVCADVDESSAGAECTDECLASSWNTIPLQIIDPEVCTRT